MYLFIYLFIMLYLNEREKKDEVLFSRCVESGIRVDKELELHNAEYDKGNNELKWSIRVTDASLSPEPYAHRALLEGEMCPRKRNPKFCYKPYVGLEETRAITG